MTAIPKQFLHALTAISYLLFSCGQADAYTIIGSPYSGGDVLVLHTDSGPHADGYGPDGMTDNGGVTYKKWGGDQHVPAMLDGAFTGNKWFAGGNLNDNNPASTALMDSNAPSGSWLWWNAHFANPTVISHFVLRVADAANGRTPDQFQLRGSNDGTTWTVIYRFDGNGAPTPWGTPGSITNFTAVQFDGAGVDFATPAAYTQIRLEIFSATQNGDAVGITEWQLAGSAAPTPSVSLSISASTIAENAGTSNVTATISSTVPSPVTVNLDFTGTASYPGEYSRTGATILIPANQSSGFITLTSIDDGDIEVPDETITVAINSLTTTETVNFNSQSVSVTITDDDTPPPPGHIITSPYSGGDLLHLTTANNGSPGGISTPGTGAPGNPAGVTYLIQDGDGGPAAMVDGQFNGNKYFSGGLGTTTAGNMDSNTPTGNWKWFNAHFTSPTVISHFVLRTADHAWDRTPDQFQLRGSNDGVNWTVIFRYDNNASNGSANPWGTVSGSTPPNETAVQFDGGGVDFVTPAAYTQIRLEIFSVTQGDGTGITEWQLAGTAQTSGDSFASWIAGVDFSGYTSPNLTPAGDPDGDGLSNSLEYVLGSNPASPDRAGAISPDPAIDGADFLVAFNRSIASKTSDISVVIEVGTDLEGGANTWSEIHAVPLTNPTQPNEFTVGPPDSGFELITLRLPRGVDQRKYARMKVLVGQ